MICLEFIKGFSFFEIRIKTPHDISVSKKVINHPITRVLLICGATSNLYEESIEIKIQIKKIIKLSIFLKLTGSLEGT